MNPAHTARQRALLGSSEVFVEEIVIPDQVWVEWAAEVDRSSFLRRALVLFRNESHNSDIGFVIRTRNGDRDVGNAHGEGWWCPTLVDRSGDEKIKPALVPAQVEPDRWSGGFRVKRN